MTKTPAKKKADLNWDRKNMAVMGCKAKRDDVPRYHAAAAKAGTTVNAVLKAALDDLLDKYG